MMDDQGTTPNDPTVGGWVKVEHRIIVDGQEIYKGEEWPVAEKLFIDHVQDPRFMHVHHEVNKQIIPYALYGQVYWGDRRREP